METSMKPQRAHAGLSLRAIREMVPVHVKIIFKLYLLSAAIFLGFRLVLLLLNLDRLGDGTPGEVLRALVMGLRFDLVVTGYVVALPALVLTVFAFVGRGGRALNRGLTIALTVLFGLTFIVSMADIPYFQQFFERFNATAFGWMATGDLGFVLGMIAQEPAYSLLLIPLVGVIVLFYWLTRRILRRAKTWEPGRYLSKSIFTLLLFGLMFVGIRGRLSQKSPIRVGTAYFCSNPLLNQLGLNPFYTLLNSWMQSRKEANQPLRLMPDDKAREEVCRALGLHPLDANFPLAREVRPEDSPRRFNVVLVLMESMSLRKTAHGGSTGNYTPFLDSLMDKSLFFSQFYSTGTHTYCGVYSTLVSYPVIYNRLPMKRTPILRYNGLAQSLRQHGYSTVFFTTHDSQFDNMHGFTMANGFERVVSQADYPRHEVKTTLGVPDDYMFRFAMPILNDLARRDAPFLATLLTSSDHGPYYLPDYFTPRSSTIREQIVEYADYSLQQFMRLASQQPWFDSTMFVFVADHGATLDAVYPIPLTYFHVPLIVHMPGVLQPAEDQSLGSQLDIFPTIMGLLRLPYVNNSFGVDLLSERRPYVLLMGDDKYAVLDGEWLYIDQPKAGQEGLYRHAEQDPVNHLAAYPEVAARMRDFGLAQMQLSEHLLDTKRTWVEGE